MGDYVYIMFIIILLLVSASGGGHAYDEGAGGEGIPHAPRRSADAGESETPQPPRVRLRRIRGVPAAHAQKRSAGH
jgi:hypothetical protein